MREEGTVVKVKEGSIRGTLSVVIFARWTHQHMASRLQYRVDWTRKRDLPCGETFSANHIALNEALSVEAYAGAH
mgnify:CR=1 FL=1